MKRSVLTPPMRRAVAIMQPGQDLCGLVHGATINGLVRKGLVQRLNGYGEGDHEGGTCTRSAAMRATEVQW